MQKRLAFFVSVQYNGMHNNIPLMDKQIEREVERLRKRRHKLMECVTRREELVHGSLVQTRKKCGRKQCACERSELHPHIYLSKSVKGKSRIVYLSKKEAEKIRNNIKAYREVMDLLESISDINIKVLKLEEAKLKSHHASNR